MTPTIHSNSIVSANPSMKQDMLLHVQRLYDDQEVGAAVGDNLAVLIKTMLPKSLSMDILKEKLEAQKAPENCKDSLSKTLINREIFQQLKSPVPWDILLQKIQTRLLKGLIPLLYLADELNQVGGNSDKLANVRRYLSMLIDGNSLSSQANIEINSTRWEMINPPLNGIYQQLCSPHVPVAS